MRSIENTAVNDLIARASGRRPSASMAMVDDADGDPDPDAAQLTLPVAMPVAAPFEARRATSSYPVVHRGPAVAASPEWPPATAPEFLEPASPRRLYELASQAERSETAGGASRWTDHERMVPTFQMRRPSEVRSVLARLVFPVALLVSIGVVVGAYVAFSGDRGGVRGDLASGASAATPPEAPAVAPAAPTPAPARAAPTVTAAPAVATAPVAPSAPGALAAVPVAPAAAGAAPASPELVDVRIDSMPAGATVMLVDRGRAQLIGDTPVDTAVDPSREYDLVFTSAGAPPHIEHLDPRTTRRVEVALGKRDGSEPPAEAPRRVERAPAEHAPAEHAPAEHAPAERAAAEHAPAEHAPARPGRPRPEPRAETRSEPPSGQGTLMISSKPPCEIVIDGRATGLTTPQRSIALPAGSHRITLLNSEKSIRKVVSVQIIANTTAKIIEDLMQ
jgi:hypothetical protein